VKEPALSLPNGAPSVIVVGGGLAGQAAACHLVDAGLRVTLIEKRPFLGGRVYSHLDKRSGLEVDNGQHVFLGCCTQYIRFLKKLGVNHRTHLQQQLRVPVIDKVTGSSVLYASRLPAPFQLLPSFLRYRPLSLGQKLLALYALARIRSLDPERHPELDTITFERWLRCQGQSHQAIANFWNLIVQPTLNEDSSRASAGLALMVFQDGFLGSNDGANVGYARVGLSTLLAEVAGRYIQDRGGQVLLGSSVEALVLAEGRVAGVALADGATLSADYAIFALPPKALWALLPPDLRRDPFFSPVAKIESSPIVNVHLWYDRPVTGIDFAAFLNSPLQWLFNKSVMWESPGPQGQYLDISLSGAHDFIDLPGQEIIHTMTREVQAFFPAARTATVKRALVIKQKEATFAPGPGIAALRRPQRTPIASLFLAGDWTQTGWPATMESAVRSGAMVAREVLRESRLERRWEMAVPVSPG
jgi:squalene-associated FAD-dependent desaturase